jgi:TPP-dependent 2-oxoacid decarboxylase
MIVLRATQDKILAILQSVAGIVERRHTLLVLNKVIIHKTGADSTVLKLIASNAYPFAGLQAARNWAISALPRCIGFFTGIKANLRNAP